MPTSRGRGEWQGSGHWSHRAGLLHPAWTCCLARMSHVLLPHGRRWSWPAKQTWANAGAMWWQLTYEGPLFATCKELQTRYVTNPCNFRVANPTSPIMKPWAKKFKDSPKVTWLVNGSARIQIPACSAARPTFEPLECTTSQM